MGMHWILTRIDESWSTSPFSRGNEIYQSYDCVKNQIAILNASSAK